MKNILKRLILISVVSLLMFNKNIYAKSVNIDTYEIDTEESIITTDKMINLGTIQYSKPSSVYDFIDENGLYNTVYTSESTVYWSTFDANMNEIKRVKIPMYFDKSNTTSFMQDLVYNFGNALYYNEHLYVVYGREGESASTKGFWDVTMAIVMYDKEGNQINQNELVGTQLNPTNFWDLGGGDWTYGTYLPFYPNSNCSLTISDGIIACFFGRQMYISHSSSMVFFVDAESLEYVSNRYYASEENVERYYEPSGYYSSHSMGQRIIGTSDGGYIMAEIGDAGTTRGLIISKIYEQDNVLKISKNRMIHLREGGKGTHGYNYTYSSLGNILELKDGYMYIGSMENTLSLDYGNSINESWNIFAQKYTKEFWKKESIKDMQSFDTYVRTTEGTPPEDASLGVNASLGRIYLNGDEEDYGIKWLSDFNNEYMAILVRAVKISNNKIAVLYEQLPLKENSENNYSLKSNYGDTYFMIIDGNANIISNPVKLNGVKLNEEELYTYKNGKIYWTTTNDNGKGIVINVLDVEQSADYINDSYKYLKGDLDQNDIINANDAAIALDLYKYGNITDENLKIGDMDDNGVINANDAALILDLYKYGE